MASLRAEQGSIDEHVPKKERRSAITQLSCHHLCALRGCWSIAFNGPEDAQHLLHCVLFDLMPSTRSALLLVVCAIGLKAGADITYVQEQHTVAEERSPLVCVIVRTYWGHGDGGSSDLKQLLQSLQRQKFSEYVSVAIA